MYSFNRMKNKIHIITVKEKSVTLFSIGAEDYISLTDIARFRNPDEPKDVVKNWLRNRSTLEFLGLWEQINNPNFKGVEFDSLLYYSGSNSFTLSPSKWIETTQAIGIVSKAGRGGGTYAQKDIAFEFAAWMSAEFKLYLIKEFQRLKADESKRLELEWNIQRTLSKVNYHIHTDAIKENLIPSVVTKKQLSHIYASEADLLNVALFGFTTKEWQDANPEKKGNMRDHATFEQLVVLANLESLNAVFIGQRLDQAKRLSQLNQIAIKQLQTLLKHKTRNILKKK